MDYFLKKIDSYVCIVALVIAVALIIFPFITHAAVCEIYTGGTFSGLTSFGYPADSSAAAQQFTPSANCAITEIGVWVAHDPSSGGSQDVNVSLYSDSGGQPGSLLAAGSSLARGSISTIPTFTKATSTLSYSVTSGTPYWIVLEGSSPSSPYYQIGGQATSGSVFGHRSFGGAWTVPYGTQTAWYEVDGTVSSAPTSLGHSWFFWW